MPEYVYYETALGVIAEGIVLKEHESIPSMEIEGMLVECIGAAPFDEQPFSDRELWEPEKQSTGISVQRAYEIFSRYLSEQDEDDINQNLHIISPEDVVERWSDKNE